MNKNGLRIKTETPPRFGTPKPLVCALLLAVFLASFEPVISAQELVRVPGAAGVRDTGGLADEPGARCDSCASIGEGSAAAAQAPHDRYLRWAIAAHRSAALQLHLVESRRSEPVLPTEAGSSNAGDTATARPLWSASSE